MGKGPGIYSDIGKKAKGCVYKFMAVTVCVYIYFFYRRIYILFLS